MGLYSSITGANDVNSLFVEAGVDQKTDDPLSKPRIGVTGFFERLLGFFVPGSSKPRYDGWTLVQKQNQYLFTFYVLIYLFYQYDGVITKGEQQLIKQLIHQSRDVLTRDHYQRIAIYSKNKIHLHDVIMYIEEHKLSEAFVHDVLMDLHKWLHKHLAYQPLINDLEMYLKKRCTTVIIKTLPSRT